MQHPRKIKITRKWAMPNAKTFEIKPIKQLIYKWIKPHHIILNPFSNDSGIGICNDLNPKFNTDYNLDFMDFFKLFNPGTINVILLDPPYSPTQIKQCYDGIGIKGSKIQGGFYSRSWEEILRLQPELVIQFGWHTNGRKKYYDLVDFLDVPHGSQHNDTLVSVWRNKYGPVNDWFDEE